MRSVRGARRPLVALIALVVALAVGYTVRAVGSGPPLAGPAASPSAGPSASPSAGPSGRPAADPAGSPAAGGSAEPAAGGSAEPAGTVALSALPPQARTTVGLVVAGGPFPYPQHDGVVFGNREGHLPREPEGYYREYTVPTPGADDRGGRRLITGGAKYWYTGDHYDTFQLVDVRR